MMLFGDRPHALRNSPGPHGTAARSGRTPRQGDGPQFSPREMEMTEGSFVPLPGSERETISGVQDIVPVDPGERIEVTLITRRRVKVAGTAAQLTQAFGTTLRRVSSPDPTGTGRVQHRYREDRLMVPAGLEGIVIAVLGLDDRPQVSPHFRLSAEAATPASYTPPQVAQAYQFPAGT